MDSIFKVHMLPARQGDCLCIEYGDPENPSRVLIDSGVTTTADVLYKWIHPPDQKERKFELVIITHVCEDHICGLLKLLGDNKFPVRYFDQFWFNGKRHLIPNRIETKGPKQGDELTDKLFPEGQNEARKKWNEKFDGGAVVDPKADHLPVKTLPGGMKLTLLSPGVEQLKILDRIWKNGLDQLWQESIQWSRERKTPPPDFNALEKREIKTLLAKMSLKKDISKPNGSSIAFLAEFDNRRVLFAGDAYADVLEKNIERLLENSGNHERLKLDAFKLPHHGSKYNLSPELLQKLDCSRYLFSTDGTTHHHPDWEAVARTFCFGGEAPELMFNYRSKYNEMWDNPSWMEKYGYRVNYPELDKPANPIEL